MYPTPPVSQPLLHPRSSPHLINPFNLFNFVTLLVLCVAFSAPGQTAFLDFNTVGQYTNNFNRWNDNGGTNGGNYSFMESLTSGVGGGGGVSVFQSSDTTATYKSGSWDFSTNGATIVLSVVFKANGMISGNKVQFGILNSNTNGLNGNTNVAFETYRFIPNTGTNTWSLREQYRTTNANFETTLGNASYITGHWYKFTIALTNTSVLPGAGTYNAGCGIYDFGTNGLTQGTNIVTFSTVMVHTNAQDIATNTAVWPALRGYQNAGIDAWDNLLVFTTNSKPVFTIPLTNSVLPLNQTATFVTLAEGPGNIAYAWYTNGTLVPGASGTSYTSPPVTSAYTNIAVVASNNKGSTTNSATISTFAASVATVTNLPASNIQQTSATLNGQVLTTGGDPPVITIYYGTSNGGTNAGSWASSGSLGQQSGSFAQAVSGLSVNTTYYFAAKAVNSGGTSWATPSASFATLPVLAPTMTNLPATAVTATSATLNGQVVSTGGALTTVTIFYGPVDGGANPAAWSNSIAVGIQTGAFSTSASSLSSNTTYFFTCRGVNSAGTTWAAPSLSLMTPGSGMTPIALTGFNRDMIIENTASGPPFTNFAMEFNPGENTCFYQSGLAGKTYGLPASGNFLSAFGDGTTFQFQPYTGSNALVMSSETGTNTGTLRLTTPTTFSRIAILANSANGGGTAAVTLNFSDGSNFATNYTALDWFFNSGFALQGVDRINLTSGNTDGGPAGDPRFYQTTLDLAAALGATNKPLSSLTFNMVGGVGATAIYAVSGLPTNSVSLPQLTNTPATGVVATAATVGGQVTTTGGETPVVTLYYGPVNGGTVASAWSNNIALGRQGGAFSQNLTGLGPNSTYFFTAKAVNSAGTTWATPSLSFTTLASAVASITNLPASGILANAATLNGQVLAGGNDAPNITIFYGKTDGGTNAGSWSNNVAIGIQTGAYSQTVSGLATNTTYFFASRATNSSGTSWAVPSKSFSTLLTNPPAPTSVAVLTYHNDNSRTGANTNETILTPANVNTNTFGLVASRPVDDQIYAQPLVMTNVSIPGRGTHNLVIVATVNDTIYAFDADDMTVSTPYWQTNLLVPNSVAPKNSDMTGACGGNYQDFHGNMGIVGTPVIDPLTGTLYVLARTKENNVNFVQRLHALDVATGTERPNSPVIITATYPGFGSGSSGGVITFDAMKQNPRPGLALNNGVVYVGWSSHCDWGPYHGLLMGFNATTLARVSLFDTTPNGGLGGIWSSGNAPAIDAAGNIFFTTGNGSFDATTNNYADSFLRLSATNGLALADYFTPYNQNALNNADLDVASSGNMLLPDSLGSVSHPHLIVGGSKGGTVYLVDRDSMGHFNAAGDTQIVQSITNATGQCYDTPALFNNFIYMLGTGDHLKAYTLSGGLINPTTPVAQSPGTFGFAAPTASVSANGTSNGIVWALQVDGWASAQPAILHAYNATNIAQELYNSSQAGSRDLPAGAIKFTVPTVANGKVYVGGQGALSIFGNVSAFVATPVIAPNGGTFTNMVTVTITDTTSGATIYYTLDGTTPTTSSTLYTGPFVLMSSSAVKAKAFKPGAADSGLASATFFNSSAIGNGVGLQGAYYSNHFPTNAYSGSPSLVRTDSMVNFNWGNGSPDPLISTDNFTVRWTGTIQPQFNEPYTFYTTTDDGVRVWVNGQLIIDHWVDQGPTEWSGSLSNLVAQQKYNIEMDYYEHGGGATATLSWSSPSTTKAIIPQSQLYSVTNALPFASVTAPTNGANYTASASVTINASASESGGSIAKVDFYANNTFLGTVSNAPYANTAIGLGAGSYALTVRAMDAVGVVVTSAPVNIIVIAGSGQPYGLPGRVPVAAFLNMPATNTGPMPALLSQTGAFGDTPNLTPIDGLIPYSVNVPLWSDSAVKTRWMSVPNNGVPYTPSEQIAFAPTGEWSFPNGTVFVKHFELITDETNPSIKRRLETRLLVRDNLGAVYGVTYKWRADNSDADLLSSSLSENIIITNASGIRTQAWYYPSPADCLTCHTPAANYVLGVKTRQLNGNFTYASTGVADNQLRTLNRLGLLYPAFDEAGISGFTHLSALTNLTASLEERARSYLDANCAQCHRPTGTGPTFDARYDTPLTNQNIINADVQKGDLGYDNAKVVVPQDVWRSILYDRMNTTDPAIKMPNLARNLIDTNAVQVMADWINSLPGTPALTPPSIIPAGGSFLASALVSLQHPDTNAALRYTLDSSLPTTNSTLYTGAFTLTNTATVRAKAFEVGFNESVAANALFSIRPPIFFTPAIGFNNNNQFQMQVSGLAGKSYVLQATLDLMNWTSLSTNVAPSNVFNIFDPGASNFPSRVYRALELP
jgi:uncharacterized repeat protein (TIGR03806 family)